jgi:iron complex transport system ATP-binding protein
MSADTAGSLQACALTLRRGARAVLDGVSLTFVPGTWTALVGPNGAGKSSLLQALAGVWPADGGQVRLLGQRVEAWPLRERARVLAWMPQSGEAQGELAVRDVVALGRLPHHGLFGAPGDADARIVQEALALTDCDALSARPLSALSGGERQRVLLARAFAVQSRVLLLDEPTAHLDAPHVSRLTRHLRARVAAGDTVVTVLHDLTLALQADRVIVLREGTVRADGVPGEPMLHAALEAAFDHAVRVQAVPPPEAAMSGAQLPPRWVALLEQSPP